MPDSAQATHCAGGNRDTVLTATSTFQFWMPTTVLFGVGVIERLPHLLHDRWPTLQRMLLVTGQSAMERSGVLQQVMGLMKGRIITHARVSTNPDLHAVEAVRARARECGAELIVGCGGGSAMDVAKSVAVLMAREERLEVFLDGARSLSGQRTPCIAIPTTAGTASEVTSWATIWNQETRQKHSLTGPEVYPDLALVDPQLTYSAPPLLTASTGMDAMTHAIEACWSKRRNPVSTTLGLQAIRIILDALPVACGTSNHPGARAALAQASVMAGLAFSQTQTAAAHAISYPLTARFGVPHGVACSISVPALLCLNGRADPDAVSGIASSLGESTVEGAADALTQFMDALPMPRRLHEFGVTQGDLPLLAKEGLTPSRASNNPFPIDATVVEQILRGVI